MAKSQQTQQTQQTQKANKTNTGKPKKLTKYDAFMAKWMQEKSKIVKPSK